MKAAPFIGMLAFAGILVFLFTLEVVDSNREVAKAQLAWDVTYTAGYCDGYCSAAGGTCDRTASSLRCVAITVEEIP